MASARQRHGSLSDLPFEELRRCRAEARREAELARMRSRQAGRVPSEEVARLDAAARALTDELIARYAADLSLVDSLLIPAYPAKVTTASGQGARR
jgi:hypothetical protein